MGCVAAAAPPPVIARVDGEYLADHEQCEGCHAEIHAQWSTSAHRFASFDNPIYRIAVDRFRQDVGKPESVFCGRCHDPALVVDGAMDREIDAADPRAQAGVTCQLCHGIEHATRDGNGSWRLRSTRIFLPDPEDEASIERHRRDARPLPGVELCGSCHRGVLSEATGNPAALTGMDDLAGWGESRFAGTRLDRLDDGPGERRGCRACHMPAEGGAASHRFLGGHTWLAQMRGDADTLARVQAFLRGSADLDAAIQGDRLTVAVRNVRAGHRLPGGVRDAQDTRLLVEVRGAGGELLWRDDTHRLAAWVADADGHVVRDRATHQFRAPVADHTLPPGGTRLARYHLPEGAAAVRILLVHRSRTAEVQELTCHIDERGCPPQPETVVAELEVTAADRPPDRPLPFALAALGDLPERIGDLPGDAYVLGRRRARLGDVAAALSAWRGAPDHPALHRARGRALASIWQFEAALPELRAAARSAPESVSAWRELAIAAAAAGRSGPGLEHGLQHGLTLAPTDPDLLRIRALATGAADDLARWQTFRGPDNAGALRMLCGQRSAACKQARRPIPELRAPGAIAMQPR